MPHHPLGIDKLKRLGKVGRFENLEFLNRDNLVEYIKILNDKKVKVV